MAPQQPARSKSSRKRRRRQASYSPSASSSGGSDSEAASSQAGPSTLPAQILPAASANKIPPSDSDDSESSDDSDEDEEMPSESQSDDESESTISSSSTASQPAKTFPAQPDLPIPSKTSHMPRRMSDSPSPPPIQLPSFFAPRRSEEDDERRLRFRRLYMDKLVQGFSGDLEALRASEPTLSGQRLQRLIDSLASGIDIFHDAHRDQDDRNTMSGRPMDEVGLILGES